MKRKYPYREQIILDIARNMINYNYSCMQIEKEMLIPHSTAHYWLTRNLRYIDDELYIKCKNIMKKHKRSRW